MKRIFVILVIINFQIVGKAQVPNLEWAVSMSGNTTNSIWQSNATDLAGNIYTLGYFDGTIDFNPGTGTNNVTSNGQQDVFIQKMDPNGNFLWVKTIEGAFSEGYGIVVNSSNEVFLAGIFRGTVDFDPGIGVVSRTSQGNTIWADCFVLKLDANGNFLWVKSFGGIENDAIQAMTTDYLGNLFLTGTFIDTVDFDPGTGVVNLISTGWSRDYYVLKLDLNGNFLWVKQMEGGSPLSKDIKVDVYGNIFILGGFSSTVDFDPGLSVFNLTNDGGNADVFIQKLDSNGNLLWAKSFGNPTPTETVNAVSMVIDTSGNVCVVGFYYGATDFNPNGGITNLTPIGVSDVFVLKLNGMGDFLWAKSFGGSSSEWVDKMEIDASGGLYLIGQFSGTADFNPGTGVSNLTSVGNEDVYIQKLNMNGELSWVGSVGGSNSDQSLSLVIGATGKVYCSGWFSGIADFDPGVGVFNLNTGTGSGFFVLKLGSTVGVEKVDKGLDFSIHPNPVSNQLTIASNYKINAIKIIDLAGRLVKIPILNTNTIDVSDLPKGIYFIQLNGENNSVTKKFVKN